jgi:hypothetical protein
MPKDAVSKLPPYRLEESSDFPGWVKVYCPYKDCVSHEHKAFFLVLRAAWLKGRYYTSKLHPDRRTRIRGRSCPYCFRVGAIPSGRRG